MCGYELGVILDIYDTPVYCVYLWIVLIWQVLVCSRFYRNLLTTKVVIIFIMYFSFYRKWTSGRIGNIIYFNQNLE